MSICVYLRFISLSRAIVALAVMPTTESAGEKAADWMSRIPAATRVSRITLPGTHNSAARHEPLPGTAKCQTLDLTGQLRAGVRFLDLRCRHVDNAFGLYHGMVGQRLTFDAALGELAAFLTAHPAECVLVSIKEEHTPERNTRSFEETFHSYTAREPGRWWLGTTIPTLAEVRGKLLLVRRFRAVKPTGLDASHWPDNSVFSAGMLAVQDVYQVPDPDAKWRKIETALTAAREDRGGAGLHLNFTSGYRPGAFGLPDITAVSGAINPRLAAWFAQAPPAGHGCVIMDFADAATCAAIIKCQPAPP